MDRRREPPPGSLNATVKVPPSAQGPYDFGNSISIPAVVRMLDGKPTIVRLDPRDPNYHRFFADVSIAPNMRKAG